MLQALQQREESVRNGKLTTIIFIRDKNAKGQEVSGYIDYGHRYGAHATEGKLRLAHPLSSGQCLELIQWSMLRANQAAMVHMLNVQLNPAGVVCITKMCVWQSAQAQLQQIIDAATGCSYAIVCS